MSVSFLPIILVLCFLYVGTNSQTVTAVAQSDRGNSFSQISYKPRPTSISIKGVRATVNTINDTASAQAIGYSIVIPPEDSDGIGFYFGYFTAEASFDIGTSHSTSISASLLELLVNFFTIFVYYERNGYSGYQYKLGDGLYCSDAPTTSDCMDWTHSLQLKDLSWAPINAKLISCPANYSSSCKAAVFYITTNGTDAGIVTFAFKVASQPVYFDGVLVTPDYGKLDVSINFPWNRFNSSLNTNPRIGLLGAVAGKTESASTTYSRVNDKPSIEFSVGGKIGSFQWQETSENSKRGVSSTVYFQNITDKQINLACSSGCTGTLGVLNVAVGAWNFLGWKVAILLFSWDTNEPKNVYWDPTIGLYDNSSTPNSPTTSPTPSVSSGLVASVFLGSLFVCLFSLLK